jgi:hypothetical protein
MIQRIEQTDDEKMVMYMKLPKKEIIEMLIRCNNYIESKPLGIKLIDNTQKMKDLYAEKMNVKHFDAYVMELKHWNVDSVQEWYEGFAEFCYNSDIKL